MTDHEHPRGHNAPVTDTPEHEASLDAQLDDLLQTLGEVPVSAQLQRRVAEIPLRHPRATEAIRWWPWAGLWKNAAVALLICALGALAGASDVAASVIDEPAATGESSNEGLALAFGISTDEDTTP